MQRILITGPKELSGVVGGQGTHIKNFKKAFKNRCEVNLDYLYSSRGLYNDESIFLKILISYVNIFVFFIKSIRANKVHINCAIDNRSILRDSVFVLISKLFLRKFTVIQFHGGQISKVSLLRRKIFKSYTKFILRQADKVLVLTRQQHQELTTLANIKPRIIPNFVEYKKKEISIKSDQLTFLYLGRIDDSKGIFQILDASEQLIQDAIKNFKVLICGSGPATDRMVEQILLKNISKNVIYKGSVTGPEKVDVMCSSDICLLPSYYAEGFPYSVLEAMTNSMPIISTTVGALAEVVNHKINGYLIKQEDVQSLREAMEFFIINPNKVVELGDNANKDVENKYSFQSMQSTFFEIWNIKK